MFSGLIEKLTAQQAPARARLQHIKSAYHEWAAKETQRPHAVLETTPPPEVEQALAKAQRVIAQTGAAFFREHDKATKAELEKDFLEADRTYQRALEAMAVLRQREREFRAFAAACGDFRTPSLVDPLLNPHAREEWRLRVLQFLHPQPAAPRPRAVENRLELPV